MRRGVSARDFRGFKIAKPSEHWYYGRMTVAPRLLASDQEIAQDQGVHLGAQKTVDGFFRAADDGLVVVEGGVEHHRKAGEPFERFDELPVTGIGFARDGLPA